MSQHHARLFPIRHASHGRIAANMHRRRPEYFVKTAERIAVANLWVGHDQQRASIANELIELFSRSFRPRPVGVKQDQQVGIGEIGRDGEVAPETLDKHPQHAVRFLLVRFRHEVGPAEFQVALLVDHDVLVAEVRLARAKHDQHGDQGGQHERPEPARCIEPGGRLCFGWFLFLDRQPAGPADHGYDDNCLNQPGQDR